MPRLISRHVLEGFRRERIYLAVAELAHEGGAGALTMAAIVKRGRMSRNTFYDLFADKRECLDLACEFARDCLVTPLREAGPDSGAMNERLERAIAALVAAVSAQPVVAELCLVHAPSVSPLGRELGVDAVVEALIAALKQGGDAPDGGSPGLEEFVAATIVSIVATRARRGEAAELGTLQSELTELAARLWTEPAERVGAP